MNQYIASLKQHPAWPELAAHAKTKLGLPNLEDTSEVELLGAMWHFVLSVNPHMAANMLHSVEASLDQIMFAYSAGN